MSADTQERFDAALSALLARERQRGLEEGLMVAERIVCWLTRQPDSERQAEVRGWAETAIRKARGT